MQDTTYSLGPLLAEIRAERRRTRAARAARRALRTELSQMTSPADFIELDAILGRHSEAETSDLREILNERRPAA